MGSDFSVDISASELLGAILTALGPLGTAVGQETIITALSTLATATSQSAILAAVPSLATAANQTALLAALNTLATAANQASMISSLTSMNSSLTALASPEDKTLAGKAFCVTTNDISSGASGGVETAQFLLSNPGGSGKRAKIYLMTFGTNVSTNNNIFRLYMNPTVTSNGTALTPVSLHNTSGPPSSAMNFYKVPSVSGNGTQFGNIIAGATALVPMTFSPNLTIEPGQKMLVGVRPNTTGVTYSINCFYVEEA